jgi:hypothetical protein
MAEAGKEYQGKLPARKQAVRKSVCQPFRRLSPLC